MDWVAGFVEILAKIVIGQKSKWGWIIGIFSGAMWTIIALQTQLYGLLIITIPAFFINMCNFYKWNKSKNKEKKP